MQIKLTAVFAFVLLFLVILLTRITKIAITDGRQYAKKVLSQENYDSLRIPYRRGEIRDRNGIILAKSDLFYNVVLDCKGVNEAVEDADGNEKYIVNTAKALAEVFDLDEDELKERITGEDTRESRYEVVKRQVTVEERDAFEAYTTLDEEEIAAFGDDKEALNAERSRLASIVCVSFEDSYKRDYPYNTLASKVVGFANASDVGMSGIENYYNDLLNGTDGRTYGYLNSDSEFERAMIPADHGKNLVTTLDMNIQEIVEKYIAEFDEEYGDEDHHGKGAKNVAVVAMNPKNGEILAMADNHGYNLNNPRDITDEYTGAEIKKMSDTKFAEALNDRWSNFAVSYSYEPGSVVKPITIASALEAGAVHDGDGFVCDGSEFITDTKINCDNIYGHGDETLEYAIVNSCNDALMQIGMRLGISAFTNYQQNFGFGSRTGIDLPDETAGVIYTRANMHEVELATCAFGQGFTCSMVQEIAAFSAAINGGSYYQPHVVKQVQNADGTVEKNVEGLELKQLISTANSALIRRYITTAVQEGTGRQSQVPGYLTGGKTGTAEKIDPETGRRATGKYLVSFIGACPMDDPQIVIYVVVDEPNVLDQANSGFAQVIFRKIATEVFPYLGLYPTEEVTQELLSFLGLTEADIVTGSKRKSSSFQAFDSYGNLYNDAYVNSDNQVVTKDGTVVEGAVVQEDGTIIDGYGNVASDTNGNPIVISEIGQNKEDTVSDEGSQRAVDNPNMAVPLQDVDDGEKDDSTTWSGVTKEDLEEDKQNEEEE